MPARVRGGRHTYYPGNYFNKTSGTLFYTPDSSRPAYDNSYYKELRGRVTWQPTSKDKINASFGNEWNCDCASTIVLGNTSPESFAGYATNPSWQAQVTWSRPATSRLLLEAGSVVLKGRLNSTLFGAGGEAGGSADDPFVLDSSRNYGYGGVRALGLNGGLGTSDFGQTNERFSASYVTGSHAVKVGVQYLWALKDTDYGFPASRRDTTFVFQWAHATCAHPIMRRQRRLRPGSKRSASLRRISGPSNRLTLNLGLRFDYLKGSAPGVRRPGGDVGAGTPLQRSREHPELEGLVAAGGSGLQPVRQREDRDQGLRGALCDFRGYYRASPL